MKKIALLVSAAMLLTTAAFADDGGKASLQWSLWGRSIWAPVVSNPNGYLTSALGTSWGQSTRNTLFVKGDAGNIGFDLTLGYDNGSLTQSWNDGPIDVWAKPFDGLKVAIGYIEDYTLRGEADYGDWDWIRTFGTGDDSVFQGIGTVRGGAAAPISSELSYTYGPLYIYYQQPFFDNSSSTQNFSAWYDTNGTQGVFQNASYGLGYTIPGIGQVRVQNVGYLTSQSWMNYLSSAGNAANRTGWFGGYNFGVFQAAFRLTGVQNLYADIGLWIPDTIDNTAGSMNAASRAGYDWSVPVFATYTMGKLKLSVNAEFTSINQHWYQYSAAMTGASLTGVANQMGVLAGLGVDYSLGGGLNLTGDFKWANTFARDNTTGTLNETSAMIGIYKGLASGDIGIGFEWLNGGQFHGPVNGYSSAYTQGNGPSATNATGTAANNFAIPVRIDYWF